MAQQRIDYFLPKSQYLEGFQSPPSLVAMSTRVQVYLAEVSTVGARMGMGGLVTAQEHIVQLHKRSKALAQYPKCRAAKLTRAPSSAPRYIAGVGMVSANWESVQLPIHQRQLTFLAHTPKFPAVTLTRAPLPSTATFTAGD